MATEQILQCFSLEAAADLSSHQFRIVYVDSNGKVTFATGSTLVPAGVLQNTPTAGQAAQIAYAGISKLVGGSALTIGNELTSDSAGMGTPITVAAGGTVYSYAVGRVIKANAAGSGIVEAILYPGGAKVLV